jgi:hypothetical protein
VCVGSERRGVLCERALLVRARPNIYLDLVYILWLTELGAISRCLALVRTGSIILRKKFIYLFILVAFVCLSGSWRWPCFRLVSFDCVGKNTPQLIIIPIFSGAS